jgi:hypothetical protein
VKEQVCDLASLPLAVDNGNDLCKVCKNECVSHMDYFYIPDCTNITNFTKCNQFSVDNFYSKSDFKDVESVHKLDCMDYFFSDQYYDIGGSFEATANVAQIVSNVGFTREEPAC